MIDETLDQRRTEPGAEADRHVEQEPPQRTASQAMPKTSTISARTNIENGQRDTV
jgi:hypothetical protein